MRKVLQNANLQKMAQLVVVLTIALGLKYFYSVASVNDLRWILAPTTFLVEFITGTQFTFESHAGYMSEDRTFLIATSCSGVNFLIISFLMLVLVRAWRRQLHWRYLPVAMLVAYATTLVANATRIVVALYLRDIDLRSGWFSFDDVHRIEGIVVYFAFLLLLFVVTERVRKDVVANTRTLAFRSRYVLAIYYAVTIGVPLANGSYNDADFWRHAIFTISIPLVVLLPFALFSEARRRERTELP